MPPAPRPELLAPAGTREALRAAVENGADAVYFGLNIGFNARARATNIEPDDLPEIMAFLHQRGVKGYVTLNTLVFSSELEEFERTIRLVAAAGVDAVLLQDLGAVRLARAVCPDLPIHASTQMTMTSHENIAVAEELGVSRVVLARELSIAEIAKIHQQTTMPLEAFVHGALCVAYSGQCLTSESLGGRSANRGQCAQACRLPYELVCDGEDVDLGPQKYLLSPQDLAAFELTPELLAAGVISLKIEGRLKSPEYVANITRHYRKALDAATAGRPVRLSETAVREMELSFSRGFSPGWLGGNDHKRLVPGLTSAKRGVFLGEVLRVQGDRVTVRLASPVAKGDGVVFAADRAANEESGGRVQGLFQRGTPIEGAATGVVELQFHPRSLDTSRLFAGQQVWKTDDPQLTERLRQTFAGPDAHRRVPLRLEVRAAAGEPLWVRATSHLGPVVEVATEQPLEVARKHPLTEDSLREQMSRLGASVYELASLSAEIAGGPMVPLSVLSRLRQEMIARLDEAHRALPERSIASAPVLPQLRAALPAPDRTAAETPPRLHLLCRNLVQYEAALEVGYRDLTVEFQDIRQYRQAKELAARHGVPLCLATMRIQKPGEMGLLTALLKHDPAGVLVRNLAGMRFFTNAGVPYVADFSLNTTNELTAHYLKCEGAERVTASFDLNSEQMLDLAKAVPPEWLEVVIHQHMPMFHMEHCVFCSVLSPGTNHTNCGRPCDTHLVRLRDRIGMEHPLHADVGCRNTLYNATPQSGAEIVPALISRGVRDFRVELLEESPAQTRQIIEIYTSLLAGTRSGRDVWRELNATNRIGVTRGTLEERRNPLAIL